MVCDLGQMGVEKREKSGWSDEGEGEMEGILRVGCKKIDLAASYQVGMQTTCCVVFSIYIYIYIYCTF